MAEPGTALARGHGQEPFSIADYIVANAQPGSIVLFHALMKARAAERQALPVILDRLAGAGYRFASVSELLALERTSPPIDG
ncbi:MAG: hypothetical protein HY901_33305 [Deltaproteobacteria bacterium]|nr:hypothetical protein [Deltaproteobacteria bacterium]